MMLFFKSITKKIDNLLLDYILWCETVILMISANIYFLTEKLIGRRTLLFLDLLISKRYLIIYSELLLSRLFGHFLVICLNLSIFLFLKTKPVGVFFVGTSRANLLFIKIENYLASKYYPIICLFLFDNSFTFFDYSSNSKFYYNNIYILLSINEHALLCNIEIVYLALCSSKNLFISKVQIDLIPVLKVYNLSWYWKILFLVLLFIVGFIVIYQLIFSAVAAIFFFSVYFTCVWNGWDRVIEYKPELPQLNHMTWYSTYQVFISQPIARGFIVNYYFVKSMHYINLIYKKEITIKQLVTSNSSAVSLELPLTHYNYLCKRGRSVYKLTMLFSIIPFILFLVFIKWKLALYTGFSYLAILLAADVTSALGNNIKCLNSITEFNRYLWHVQYELFGSGSMFTQVVVKLRIILKYEADVQTSEHTTTILNNLQDQDFIQEQLNKLINKQNDFENPQLVENQSQLPPEELPPEFEFASVEEANTVYKFKIIFNTKFNNQFSMLKDPTHFYKFYKLFTRPNKIWKPGDIYIGDKTTTHKGLYTQIGDLILVNNMSKQRIINYLKYNNWHSRFVWDQLILNKSNSPGYDPKIAQQFWPAIHTITKEYIKKDYTLDLYSNNRALYQDIITVNTLELVFKLSNYFNNADNVTIYFKINIGGKGLIYDLQYFSKIKHLSPELQYLIEALNDFIKQYSAVFNDPLLKKDFEKDFKEFIEINTSLKYYNTATKNSTKSTFNACYRDDDPVKH